MVVLDILADVLIFIALMIIVNIIMEASIRGVLLALGKNPDQYLLQLNNRLDEMRKENKSHSSVYEKSFSKQITTVETYVKHKYCSSRLNAFTIEINGIEEELLVTRDEWERYMINDKILVNMITSVNLVNKDDVRKSYVLLERGVSTYSEGIENC